MDPNKQHVCEILASADGPFMFVIMTEDLVIHEIRIDEAAGRGDSDSRMTSFEAIMPLKLQSTTKALL